MISRMHFSIWREYPARVDRDIRLESLKVKLWAQIPRRL
jgi:hypothetical protein